MSHFDPTKINLQQLLTEAGNPFKPKKQLAAVKTVSQIFLSDVDGPINVLMKNGIVATLVQCLKDHDHTKLQWEAARALTDIVSGTSEHTQQVVAAGAVPILLELLSSPEVNIREQVVWALGNITGDNAKLRQFVVQQGLVEHLLSFMNPGTTLLQLRHIAWVFANLCRCKIPLTPAPTIRKILLMVNLLCRHSDASVLANVVWAIAFCTESSNEHVRIVLEVNVIPNLVPRLQHTNTKIQTGALRAIANIVAVSDKQTELALSCNVLSCLPPLLTHKRDYIRKDAIWLLSNIIAGSELHVQAVIDKDLLPLIVKNLGGNHLEIQTEAACAVLNWTICGNQEQIFLLLVRDVLPAFCHLLSSENIGLIYVVLRGLKNLLMWGEVYLPELPHYINKLKALPNIRKLLHYEVKAIRDMANSILTQYFSISK